MSCFFHRLDIISWLLLLGPLKKYPVSGHRLASKLVRWRAFFSDIFFCFANRKIRDTLYTWGPNFPLLYKVWWLREVSQIGQTFIPLYVKKSFKAQHGRITIDPAILAAIGHRFHYSQKFKLKMPTCGSEATCAETRNRRLILALSMDAFTDIWPTGFKV